MLSSLRRSCASEGRSDFVMPIASTRSIQACQRFTTLVPTKIWHTVVLLHDIRPRTNLGALTTLTIVATREAERAGPVGEWRVISKLKLHHLSHLDRSSPEHRVLIGIESRGL